jgi:hypothetical protein
MLEWKAPSALSLLRRAFGSKLFITFITQDGTAFVKERKVVL